MPRWPTSTEFELEDWGHTLTFPALNRENVCLFLVPSTNQTPHPHARHASNRLDTQTGGDLSWFFLLILPQTNISSYWRQITSKSPVFLTNSFPMILPSPSIYYTEVHSLPFLSNHTQTTFANSVGKNTITFAMFWIHASLVTFTSCFLFLDFFYWIPCRCCGSRDLEKLVGGGDTMQTLQHQLPWTNRLQKERNLFGQESLMVGFAHSGWDTYT